LALPAIYLRARTIRMPGSAAPTLCFAAWQAHLAANPVEGEVLFIRQMSARANGAHRAGRTACILDLKRHYIESRRMARIYCYAFAEDLDLLHRLGFRPLEQPQNGMPDTMVLEVPGGDMIEWVSALVDAGTRGMADSDNLDFARDRREIAVGGRAIELRSVDGRDRRRGRGLRAGIARVALGARAKGDLVAERIPETRN
jgi:hypothetical protein